MPEQDPAVRSRNFEEVCLVYNQEEAQEAGRCLHCKNSPCVAGCPVNIRIPEFIAKVAEGDFQAAYEIIHTTNTLPAISGRVCPQESQCECLCVRGKKGEPVAIGRLERFVADWYREHGTEKTAKPASNGVKVAVVGSGPAGLTCASDLGKLGYAVTIFEAFHTAGGVLVYGIPQFRLPKEIVRHEVEGILDMGVELRLDTVIGKTITIDELFEQGYQAVFVGSGAGLPMFMGIPGETLSGVYSANEYLTRVNLMKAYLEEYDTPIKKSRAVAVVGGGNVAMDAARCAKRIGAEHVYVVYRRSEAEMPARNEEIHHAREEGIEFHLLNNPTRILSDGKGSVAGMECIKMELGEPDASGRRRPVEVPGSEFVLDVDTVVISIGTSPNPLIKSTVKGLEVNKHGGIIVNEDLLAKAGYQLSDITNFETLKAVAEDIHSRAAELGFDAFTSSSMSGDSSWRFPGHLANLEYYYESVDDPAAWKTCPASIKGTYMQNFKNLWDLYINNSAVAPSTLAAGGYDAQAEFGKEQAVFYQNGSWEWAALTGTGDGQYGLDNLSMIPFYCGVAGEEKAGLNCGTENCWAVNAKASAEDIQATLDFMYWLVTDAEVSRMLVDEFAVMPYKQAAESTCGFLADANAYAAEGNYVMPWVTNFQPNVDAYREAIVAAMNQYDNDPTDANWEQVKTAFVDGWAVQYAAANG